MPRGLIPGSFLIVVDQSHHILNPRKVLKINRFQLRKRDRAILSLFVKPLG